MASDFRNGEKTGVRIYEITDIWSQKEYAIRSLRQISDEILQSPSK